jgi:hypothetical protein
MLVLADDMPGTIPLPAGLRASWLGRWYNGDRFWAKLAGQAGFDPRAPATLLGAGRMGQAFRVGDLVVKITTDAHEAQAMWHVANRPDPAGNVVRVQTVARFGRHPVWAIVQELLDPPDRAWAQAARLWSRWAIARSRSERPFYLTVVNVTIFAWDTFGVDLTGQRANRPVELPDGVAGIVGPFVQWLSSVAGYLADNRILFADLHDGNIMRRGSQHVVIDLGVSRSGPASIDVLEAAREFILAWRARPRAGPSGGPAGPGSLAGGRPSTTS